MYNKVVLINKENKISPKYLSKVELVETKNINGKSIKIEVEANKYYEKLKETLKQQGIEIGLIRAFRTLEDQEEIMPTSNLKAIKEHITPGYSEHHTGLALDITICKDNQPITNNDLLHQEENLKKVHSLLKDYGFILRYPENKETITNHQFSPFHIRYVGKVPAKIIYENNWTLEEYLSKFSAIIVVKKEKNMTSFSVVNEVSHLFGIKKVGHTGTLDPLAEGVLIIALGKATKIVELLTMEDKEYIAGVKLGLKTDTYDITGQVLDTKEIPSLENLEAVINSYQKTYLQEVPIYSAIKVKGKKLYEYARNNIEVELPKKEVTIKNIELLEKNDTTFKFKALVSKGTYIRSLINDIGSSLNTYATMTSLVRTKQGSVKIEEAYSLNDLKNNRFKYYKVEEVLPYKIINVDENLEKKIRNGVKLSDNWNITDKVIFRNKHDELLGIYQKKDKLLVVWKNFAS